jgi:hypothetical protein
MPLGSGSYRSYCNPKVRDIAKSRAQLTPMRTTAADSRTKLFITLETKRRPNPLFENRLLVEQTTKDCTKRYKSLKEIWKVWHTISSRSQSESETLLCEAKKKR